MLKIILMIYNDSDDDDNDDDAYKRQLTLARSRKQ